MLVFSGTQYTTNSIVGIKVHHMEITYILVEEDCAVNVPDSKTDLVKWFSSLTSLNKLELVTCRIFHKSMDNSANFYRSCHFTTLGFDKIQNLLYLFKTQNAILAHEILELTYCKIHCKF